MVSAAHCWLDNSEIHRGLESFLSAHGCDAAMVAKVRSSRSGLSTSYVTGVVDVHMRDGRALRVFLKNFDESMRRRHESDQRREREVRVYEHLLPKETLGTADYYGKVWDDARGRHWLFLEYVEGTPVRHFEVERWFDAAACLGRIHGHFASQSERLDKCRWLVRHDSDFFLANADNALRAVTELAPRLRSSFQRVTDGHAGLVPDMTGPPFTLIHGDYHARNVMICPDSDPARICVFDWETAGFGSPFYDLAHLVDGFSPPVLERFLQCYVAGVGHFGMPVPTHARMRYLVNCFRLHLIIKYLSHGIFKGYSEEIIDKLVATALSRYEETRRSANAQD